MNALTPLERKQLFSKPGALNGMFGRTHTEQVKQKLSELHTGNTYCLGLKRSDAQKRILSEMAKLRIGDKNPFFGKKHSPETIAKLSAVAKGREVLPGNTRGVLINEIEYESVTDAARKLQVTPALIVYRLKKRDKYPEYSYKDERSTTSRKA